MSDEQGCVAVFFVIFLCFCSFILGCVVGHNTTITHFEKILEEKGYAEYFINEEKESEWRWKE